MRGRILTKTSQVVKKKTLLFLTNVSYFFKNLKTKEPTFSAFGNIYTSQNQITTKLVSLAKTQGSLAMVYELLVFGFRNSQFSKRLKLLAKTVEHKVIDSFWY